MMIQKLRAWFTNAQTSPAFSSAVQFIKFSIVGISNTLISLAIYYLCYSLLGMHYQLANVLSFVVSVTNAFFWNSRYVFGKGERRSWKENLHAYGKTIISYGFTFLLSTLLLTLWVETAHIPATIAPIINLFITMPLNYFLNKKWTFRQKMPKE